MVSRWGFLIGGAATVVAAGTAANIGIEEDVLPGRVPLGRALGKCDVHVTLPPEADILTDHVLHSAARGRDVRWTLATPEVESTTPLPVVLVLHGRGGVGRTAFDTLGLHRFLAAYVSAGGTPFALVAADGGAGYWHPRASGDDPLGMLVGELLPALRMEGFATDRIGVMGWSMGGYGALLLARQSARGETGGSEVVAAAAASPALFGSYADAAGGAFDSAADFAAWGDLIVEPGVADTTLLDVRCGDTDPFRDPTRDYRAATDAGPADGIAGGCHDTAYWRSIAAAQIAFCGDALRLAR